MSKITTSDFQKGLFIIYRNDPHQITDLQFVNPGKGSAFVRTKLKSINTGRVQEFTYKSGETVEEYPVFVKEMQYLYAQADDCFFMDNSSYEQHKLPKEAIGTFHKFLKEGDTYQILVHDDQTLGMHYPKKVRLKVIAAENAIKGNTVTGAKKIVTLETGMEIPVPLFIKIGNIISIDPETGEYIGRDSRT